MGNPINHTRLCYTNKTFLGGDRRLVNLHEYQLMNFKCRRSRNDIKCILDKNIIAYWRVVQIIRKISYFKTFENIF